MKTIKTTSGNLPLPVFLPDGTRGVVRTLDSDDLESVKIKGIVVNTLHLGSKPGISTLEYHHGIHNFMNFKAPIITDSGGFQIFSLITESKKGTITQNGFNYQTESGESKKFSPEKCIQSQFKIGSDIFYCLDYCTHPAMDNITQKESVRLTIEWAYRCKEEFTRILKQKKNVDQPPLLFAVVQGGNDPIMREECAKELLKIGFDGFGFGGWPIGEDGKVLDSVRLVSDLIPDHFPKHALGIGKPENVVSAFKSGYNIFDCVIPTRDARHKRIYIFNEDESKETILSEEKFYKNIYLQDDKFIKDKRPLDSTCDCPVCQKYSRSYINHLFEIGDHSAFRLATLHNLRFYTRLIEKISNHG